METHTISIVLNVVSLVVYIVIAYYLFRMHQFLHSDDQNIQVACGKNKFQLNHQNPCKNNGRKNNRQSNTQSIRGHNNVQVNNQ